MVDHGADARLDRVMTRISPHFHRPEPRATARDYVRGLMVAGRPRSSTGPGVTATGDTVQRLLRSARWDCDAVRDELASAVTATLGAAPGVLTLVCRDFPKKGACSVGVDRRFRHGSGRVQNVQTGVLAVLATGRGVGLIDRELFLPRSWSQDADRRRRAGVPDAVEFRSTGELALAILRRCLDGPVRVDRVVCDREVGEDPRLRDALSRSGLGHAVEIGPREVAGRLGSVDVLVGESPSGRRRGFIHRDIHRDPRRQPGRTAALAVDDLDRAEAFLDDACDRVGLDAYECRHWISWYRHITLASVALHCADRPAA